MKELDKALVPVWWAMAWGAPVLMGMMLVQARAAARQMGERYTFRHVLTDGCLFWFLMFFALSRLQRADVLNLPTPIYLVMIGVFGLAGIATLLFGQKEMTLTRHTKWKMEREWVLGSTETRDQIRSRYRWITPLAVGSVVAGGGLGLWLTGINRISLIIVGAVVVIFVPYVLWQVRQQQREILGDAETADVSVRQGKESAKTR